MGCVYILENSEMPGLINIGQTEGRAQASADALYEEKTGVPSQFEVVHEYPCENHEQLGREIHQKLASHRYNADREFFEYSADAAFQLLKDFEDKNFEDRSYRRWTSQYLTRFKKKAKTL